MQWLTSSYTPFKSNDGPKRKLALKNVAASIRFAFKLRESRARTQQPSDEYVFDAQPAERAAIDAALVGVDDWAWDIEPLRVASGGRPLQTLGWHLLHQWGVGPFPAPTLARQQSASCPTPPISACTFQASVYLAALGGAEPPRAHIHLATSWWRHRQRVPAAGRVRRVIGAACPDVFEGD